MHKETILKLAEEAGAVVVDGHTEVIERFAASIIQHLAAGVSVEPYAYRFTENRGNGNTEFNYYGLDEVGMAYRDNCLEITPLYTATAIAAARLSALEDARIEAGKGGSAHEIYNRIVQLRYGND